LVTNFDALSLAAALADGRLVVPLLKILLDRPASQTV
jgi:hypothetical protein